MKFSIIGYPLAHSLSPRIYNTYFERISVNAHYTPLEIKPEEFKERIWEVVRDFRGFNVTIPHKERVIPFVELDEESRVIGAVNCVCEGRGHNTDWIGFLRSLRDIKLVEPVTVVGAGGAARAIMFGLAKLNVKNIHLVNRTIERAKHMAKLFSSIGLRIKVWDLPSLPRAVCESYTLINTTSLGLKGENLPLKPDEMRHLTLVYDVIYSETPLQNMARKMGILVIGGKAMLYHQAVENLKIWRLLKDPKTFEEVFKEVVS